MTQDINEILAQRKGTHGSFTENARIVEALMNVYRGSPNWGKLPDTAKEVMHMTAHKQARILSGNFGEPDHWLDISGYNKLEHDECVRRDTVTDKAVAATVTKHANPTPDSEIAAALQKLNPGEWLVVPGHFGAVLMQPRDGELGRMTCDCIAVCYEADAQDGTGGKVRTVRYIVNRNALTPDALERMNLGRLPATPTWAELGAMRPWHRVLYGAPGADGRVAIKPHFTRWTTV